VTVFAGSIVHHARLLLQPVAVAPQTALEAGGPGAARIGDLWNVMLLLGAITTVIVLVVMAIALFRRRGGHELPPEADRPADPRGELANVETGGRGHEGEGRPESERKGTRWMLIGGVAFPAVVLVILLVFSLRTLSAVSPRRASDAPLTVEVIGKQWWWQVRYASADPSLTFETANEIRIPVGTRVRVKLESSDVIHSFWVPGLQGKTDMVPGRINVTWLQADKPGVWRGQCAEFCGVQHAKMGLVVVAEPRERFEQWLSAQRRAALPPRDSIAASGLAAFVSTGCVLCHRVRGTPAAGRTGPDLTHVGSRLTLAAGEFPNTRGHIQGWIGNPQALKPGSRMPAVALTSDQLHSIAYYLTTLR
jgi:cytochrome c oxidase subunit 2